MTDRVVVSNDKIVQDFAAVVEGNEEYLYEAPLIGDRRVCAYFDEEGAPSCIVGHVLARNGLTLDMIKEYDPDGSFNKYPVDWLISRGLVACSSLAAWALADAQRMQDVGVSWGAVLERVEALMRPLD